MKDRIEYFKRAILDFRKSDQAVNNYMDLIFASVNVTRQGSGLVWPEIEHILHEILKEGT